VEKRSPSQQGGTCPLSEIRVTTVSNAAGTGPVTLTKQHAAKVWVNMDGTGTISVRDSLNVTSLTDIGTGQYAVNISSSMANANYAIAIGAKDNAYGNQNFTGKPSNSTQTTSLFRLLSYSGSDAYQDNENYMASAHGDLA